MTNDPYRSGSIVYAPKLDKLMLRLYRESREGSEVNLLKWTERPSNLEVDFAPRLNVITGEGTVTSAGQVL